MIDRIVNDYGNKAINKVGDDILKIIKTNTSCTIETYNGHKKSDNINALLYKLDKDKYNKHRSPTRNSNLFRLQCNVLYFIKLKNNIIKVETVEVKTEDNIGVKLILSFFGKNRYKIRDRFINESTKISVGGETIIITAPEMKYSEPNISSLPKNSFDNLILEKEVKDKIVLGLTNWKKDKHWYRDHQMVHKIGVLLYGDPGTGKSTIARAISNMFDNATILTLDTNQLSNSIEGILNFKHKSNSTIIVLIEDFDMYFINRDDTTLNAGEIDRINHRQNIIFQILDGVYSTGNTIYIATTNYKDKLDPALIRYGRFDIQAELTYFDRDRALEAVNKFGYDETILDSFNLEYPVQPAFLQSKIMEYRANTINNPDLKSSLIDYVSKNINSGKAFSFNKEQYMIDSTGQHLRYIGNSIKPEQPIGLTDYSNLFSYSDLSYLDLSDWDMSQVINTSYMFYTSGIKNIDSLSQWDMSKVENVKKMFYRTEIENLDALKNWDLCNVNLSDKMFGRCNQLKDINGFEICYICLKVNNCNVENIFDNCKKLDVTYVSLED